MDQLSPEVVFYLTRFLAPPDVRNLACTSRDMYDMTLGNDYCKSYVQAKKGMRFCCQKGSLLSIQLCLRDPDFDPVAEADCMNDAAIRGPEVMQLLLDDGRLDPMAGQRWCMMSAVALQPSVVELLLADERVDPTYQEYMAVKLAASTNTDSLRVLLADDRVDPTYNDGLLLRIAASAGCIDAVATVMEFAREAWTSDLPITITFALHCNFDIFKLFFDHSSTPADICFDTACMYSTKSMTKCVEYMLSDDRVDPTEGKSVMLILTLRKNLETFRLLMRDGRANPSACPQNSLWLRAVQIPEALKMLLDDGRADPRDCNQAVLWLNAMTEVESFRLLLADGRLDPCSDIATELWKACFQDNPRSFADLISKYCPREPSSPGYLPVFQYVSFKHILLPVLLDDGRIDICAEGYRHITVHVEEDLKLVKLLAQHGQIEAIRNITFE